MPKISVIVTVFNEEETIELLLNALVQQTLAPHEVIIVDAQSRDKTATLLQKFAKNHKKFPLRVFTRQGNRSVGRNFAVQQARTDWIAITDAGCVPHKNWLEELAKKQQEAQAPVIAGYYDAIAKTPFQEAVVPYALVMPDRVNEETFLPATRSMFIKKSVWQPLGGLNESLQLSEDYEFAKRLQKENFKIVFAKNAKVSWLPRKNLKEFIHMVAGMAEGDVRADVVRPKVVLVFARYVLFLILGVWALLHQNIFLLFFLIFLALLYIYWSIAKNQKYTPRGWYWLPVLQVVADVGVMWGTARGLKR